MLFCCSIFYLARAILRRHSLRRTDSLDGPARVASLST
jgi:hypothetical protein